METEKRKIIYFKCEEAKAQKEVKLLTRGHLLKKAQVQNETASSFSSSFCGLFVSFAKLRPRENELGVKKQLTNSEARAQQVKSVATQQGSDSCNKVCAQGSLQRPLT